MWRWKRRPQPGRLKVAFVMARADGPGGEARTITSLANHLVSTGRYDVELISVIRQRTRTQFHVDDRVRLTWVSDLRPLGPDGRRRDLGAGGVDVTGRAIRGRVDAFAGHEPSSIGWGDIHWAANDPLLIDAIRRSDAAVMVATRPTLNHYVGRFARDGVLKVGQDHMNFVDRVANATDNAGERRLDGVAMLDAFLTLTEPDVPLYRAALADSGRRVPFLAAIPNGLSWPISAPAPLDAPVVLAAGRLEDYKGFDRLVDAWLPVAERHPDWQLQIFGRGSRREALQSQVDALGLGEKVRLMGYVSNLEEHMRSAAMFAMSSRQEGWGMVLVEASSMGVPMVAFDCPTGPGTIIRDGVNGRLVPDGDVPGFSAALLELVADEDLRHRMGRAAIERIKEFSMPRVEERWAEVFALRPARVAHQ